VEGPAPACGVNVSGVWVSVASTISYCQIEGFAELALSPHCDVDLCICQYCVAFANTQDWASYELRALA